VTLSRNQRTLNRILISQRDAENAEEFFRAAAVAHAAGQDVACRGLVTAGIVAYARPFAGNLDHPNAVATPPFSLRLLTDEERTLHEILLTLRKKAIAHSDAEHNWVKVDAHAANGFIFSAKFHEPLDHLPSLAAMEALARTAKHLLVSSAFEASRAAGTE
jgi:hypothetical protein